MSEKRIVVKIDPDLHRRARVESVRRGVTLSDVVRDALRAFIGDKSRRPADKGVNIDKNK